MNHETKKEETNLEVIQRIKTDVLLQNIPVDELLGSVTTYSEGNDKNLALRSSARVFKKIKLDANLLNAANTSEKAASDKKEDPKHEQTPHKEQRKLNTSWITEEVTTLFYEALNEYGKDFESIHTSISLKLKKKGVFDQFTKDHVRHIYYRTWHKISKYLKFSEGVKRTIQELYGLINYGELKKKVPNTQKIYFKLNELVHSGSVSLRVKGKVVRVRTPMCTALRRLNKLDDKIDDLKLPPRVVVQLQPRDMKAFLKVQSFALNPRIRTELPLQKKLSTFINCISKRWKAAEFEYLKNMYPKEEISSGENDEVEIDVESRLITSQLKFAPPKGVKLTLARTEICDFNTKESICLNAYEERMGIDATKPNDKKDYKKSSQKIRSDSISETSLKLPNKSEMKDGDQVLTNQATEVENIPLPTNSTCVLNAVENLAHQSPVREEFPPQESTGASHGEDISINKENSSDLSAMPNTSKSVRFKKEIQVLDSLQTIDSAPAPVGKPHTSVISEDNSDNNNKINKDISLEEQLAKLAEIRNGWTVEDCDNITIGELYLMYGSASKLVLEYHWVNKSTQNQSEENEMTQENRKTLKEPSELLNSFGFSDTLRKLVDLMKMQQKKVEPKCSCGHVCSPKNNVLKKNHPKVTEAEEKTSVDENASETDASQSLTNGEEQKQKTSPIEDFVKPQGKPPPHLIAQLDSIEKLKPKYSIRKGRRLRTNQLVVERELPLLPKASSGHQIVRMNIISHKGIDSMQQPAICTEDQEPATDAIECHSERNFEPVLYMEENCNQYAEKTDIVGAPSTCRTPNMEAFLDSTRSLSPSAILKENENQWISSEVADFSLSSFLGHLESPMKSHDDASNDVDCQLRSLLTENSFDYTAKFADLANKVIGDTVN